jgi:hypothetical protein
LVITTALPKGDVDQVDVLVGFVTNSRYGVIYSPFEVSMIGRAAAGWIHEQHERIVDEGLQRHDSEHTRARFFLRTLGMSRLA